MDLLAQNKRIGYERVGVQIFSAHIYGADLAVFVGGVIINPFIRVAAAAVKRELIFFTPDIGKASGLGNGAKNVKELADTFGFRISAAGIELGKGGFYKSGRRGHISRQTDATHAQAERGQVDGFGKSVFRRQARKIHVHCQMIHVEIKGRIVC